MKYLIIIIIKYINFINVKIYYALNNYMLFIEIYITIKFIINY